MAGRTWLHPNTTAKGAVRVLSFWQDIKNDFLKSVDDPKLKKEIEELSEQLFEKKKDKQKDSGKRGDEDESKSTATSWSEKVTSTFSNLSEKTTKVGEKMEDISKQAREKGHEAYEKFDDISKKARDESQKAYDKVEDTTWFSTLKEQTKVVSESSETVGEKLGEMKEDLSKKAQTESKKVIDTLEELSWFGVVKSKVKESGVLEGWGDAARELVGRPSRKKVVKLASAPKKKEEPADSSDESKTVEETGFALMNVEQPKTNWQKITETITSTPLISEMLKNAAAANKEFAKSDVGKAAASARQGIEDTAFDLREKWETSQNPWVYRISGWSDALFAETETGSAVKEVKRFDPDFDIYHFLEDLEDDTMPTLIESYVNADNNTLRHILSEACYATVYASFKHRESAGLRMDPTVLEIQPPTLVFAKPQEKDTPLFLVQVPVQQIHCIYDRDDQVVEGAPDKVYMNVYMVALQQEVNDHEIAWKIRELMLMPDIYGVDADKRKQQNQESGGSE